MESNMIMSMLEETNCFRKLQWRQLSSMISLVLAFAMNTVQSPSSCGYYAFNKMTSNTKYSRLGHHITHTCV